MELIDERGESHASVLRCGQCGDALDGDPDDDLIGDMLGPLCGECARIRDFEADLEQMDAADGSIDGLVDW